MRKTTSVALALLALAAPLTAGELHIELDPELTSISFRLQATLHSVHGSAALAAGSLRLNTESGAMAGAVTIDATTAETGNKKRDKKMHGKVLLTADNPEIVLRAQRLEGELAPQGASDVTLHGEIEILGQSHEIGIPSHIEIDGGHFTATFEFEVPYVDWGLEDPSTFVLRVAKVVEVTVTAGGNGAMIREPGIVADETTSQCSVYCPKTSKENRIMKTNMGGVDRVVRGVLGLAIIAAGFYYKSWFGVIGLIPLVTAIVARCPAYVPFGFSTCRPREAGDGS